MRIAGVLAATLVAGQVHALSCVPTDVAQSYLWADEAEEQYVILLGQYAFDPQDLPPRVLDNPEIGAEFAPVTATFSGKALTADGFTQDLSRQVDLQVQCAGNWCGGLTPDVTVLSFVRLDGTDLTLDLEPCFGTAFTQPSAEDIARVETCVSGPCEPQTRW